ncbi:unnamed protein product [Mytilus coruscus]|uniref:Uncharacterized protein n=1 Tax=Mytilus coruscus TaxID=42192 RepID=A0A6J8A2P6_MYTCO|nr:unnamed protein product [Mytilus coruscus]
MALRPSVNVQIATEAQLKTLDGVDVSKASRLIKTRTEIGYLTDKTYTECTGLPLPGVQQLAFDGFINFEQVVTKKEVMPEVDNQLKPAFQSLKQEIMDNLGNKQQQLDKLQEMEFENKELGMTNKVAQEKIIETQTKMMEILQSIRTVVKKIQPENSEKFLEVINKWRTTHAPNNLFNEQSGGKTASTPKFNEGSFFKDYSAISQFNMEKENKEAKEGEKNISRSNESRTTSRGRQRTKKVGNTTSKNSHKSGVRNGSVKRTVKQDSSSSESNDRDYSKSSSSDSSRSRTRSPRIPKMTIFD